MYTSKIISYPTNNQSMKVLNLCSLLFTTLAAQFQHGAAFTSLTTRHTHAYISSSRSISTTSSNGAHAVTSTNSFNLRTKNCSPISALQSTPTPPESEDGQEDDGQIDITEDPRLYRIRLSRATGIEWGTDLSFSFVYVRAMEPGGEASRTGIIEVGDQICELRPVEKDGKGELVPLIGAAFDRVMGAFADCKKTVQEVDLVFFKGSKDELKALCTGDSGGAKKDGTINITVIQNKGSKDEVTKVIVAKEGANIRQTLVDEGINVYQSVTRWANCKGKQLCGTCIINVADGAANTNRKSMDEESTLRENPDTYRLSCVTFAYDDVTVETFPPINAAQWTR